MKNHTKYSNTDESKIIFTIIDKKYQQRIDELHVNTIVSKAKENKHKFKELYKLLFILFYNIFRISESEAGHLIKSV